MPTAEEQANFPQLDEFTLAYVEAALWSSCDESGTPLDKNYGILECAPATLERMQADCLVFERANAADMEVRNAESAGHDFWLTRNRHGAGYWDGDWPKEVGERLTKAAHAFREIDLYIGDDGLIYAL